MPTIKLRRMDHDIATQRFDKVEIGDPFYVHGTIYIKYDNKYAVELGNAGASQFFDPFYMVGVVDSMSVNYKLQRGGQ